MPSLEIEITAGSEPRWTLSSLPRMSKLLAFPLLILIVFSSLGIFAEVAAPYPPNQIALMHRLLPPFWQAGGTSLRSGLSLKGFKVCFDNSATGYQDFKTLWQSHDSAGIVCSDTLLFSCDRILGQNAVESVPGIPILHQNFPNPVTGTTTIPFNLPLHGHVRLSIVNALGRELMRLLDREMTAGNHSIQTDLSVLPNGMYFLRLSACGMSASRILLRLQ